MGIRKKCVVRIVKSSNNMINRFNEQEDTDVLVKF